MVHGHRFLMSYEDKSMCLIILKDGYVEVGGDYNGKIGGYGTLGSDTLSFTLKKSVLFVKGPRHDMLSMS